MLRLKIFFLIFVFSLSIFVAHILITKNAIFADARFYWSITRSLVKDKNVDFSNEFNHFGPKMAENSKGFPMNFYPPGAAFFWIPGYWFVETISVFLPKTNFEGYGVIHQFAVAVNSIFLGIIGVYFMYLTLRRNFSEKISLLTSFTFFAATNLLFYIAVEPITSHAVAFFVSSFFVYLFITLPIGTLNYFFLGLLVGIAGLVRTQDLGLVLLPLIKMFSERKIRALISLTAGIILGFAPQLLFWKFFYGTIWRSPYLDYGFIFTISRLLHVLVNFQNGLFTITPLILFALIGLVLFVKRGRKIAIYSLTYFIFQLILVSSWRDYTQGGSFGIRMLITTYPLLSFGLASIVKLSTEKMGLKITLATILILSCINMLLILRYLLMY